jgi:CheY-like chemotaxis protein
MLGSTQRTILLGDNKETAAELFQKTLTRIAPHHCLYIANNGEDLLVHLRNISKVDCIVLSLDLPKLDGFAVASIVRQHPSWKNIKVVLLGEISSKEEQSLTRVCGFDLYLPKPSDSDTYQSTIQKILALMLIQNASLSKQHKVATLEISI